MKFKVKSLKINEISRCVPFFILFLMIQTYFFDYMHGLGKLLRNE